MMYSWYRLRAMGDTSDTLRAECAALRDRELCAGRDVSQLAELLKGAASSILQAAAEGPKERKEGAAHAYRLVITAIDLIEGIDCDGELTDGALAMALRRIESN